MLKRFIKRSFRRFGFDIQRYRPDTSHEARMRTILSAHGVNTVFDVGANTGQYGSSLRELGYTGRIVSFEPIGAAWEKLRSQSEGDDHWEIASRVAIGDRDGETDFHIAANSVSSSVLPMLETHLKAAPHSKFIGLERVPLRRLDSIGPQFLRQDSVLLIKIDTQGFESQVLDGAAELLKRAVGLQLELSMVPLYEGQCAYDDLIRRLGRLDFEAWEISPAWSDPQTGRLLQVDATFFRKELTADQPAGTICTT